MQRSQRHPRVMIESVSPEIGGGRFAAKRIVGDTVLVEADIFADGHDKLAGVLMYRKDGEKKWREVELEFLGNDRWRGEFVVEELGRYHYTLSAWVDSYASWLEGLGKKLADGQDVEADLQIGARLLREFATRAAAAAGRASKDGDESEEESARLRTIADSLEMGGKHTQKQRVSAAGEPATLKLVRRYADRGTAAVYGRELAIEVDRERARFSSWYEMFPRSRWGETGVQATLKDCVKRLEYIAGMGFDILYLPPIHPIGKQFRKGKNNSSEGAPDDPGSPWAIGSEEGGHCAIHPELGTMEDFHHLLSEARRRGLEVALDMAFQCSADHPYLREHPDWFLRRPDGTIQYAENPPKKYQDIYPLNFDCDDWRGLWQELKEVFAFWIKEGIRIFRVDNPHTKPFAFWEWVIAELKREHPDLIFLAEAFTRPRVMYRLAKLGFSQSYTYFTWRNAKWELTEYFTELTRSEAVEFFRPNLWPNTPDILHEFLQSGGRPAFMTRLVLAATLGANYGIYGPAFELCENHPREEGSEEYLDSEKYEVKEWDVGRPDSLKDFITRVNRARRDNEALQSNDELRFHAVDNDQIICYSKRARKSRNTVLTVVNLDPHHVHSGWSEIPLRELEIPTDETFQVEDLLTGSRFLWRGERNYVELNPHVCPAHIFRVRLRAKTEKNFDYFA